MALRPVARAAALICIAHVAEGARRQTGASELQFPIGRSFARLAPALPLGGEPSASPHTAPHLVPQPTTALGAGAWDRVPVGDNDAPRDEAEAATPTVDPDGADLDPESPFYLGDFAVMWLMNLPGARLVKFIHDLPPRPRIQLPRVSPRRGLRRLLGRPVGRLTRLARDISGAVGKVRVPKDWAPELPRSDLRLVHRRGGTRVFLGHRIAGGGDVALKVIKAGTEASNEVAMLRRLRDSGNVVAYLGIEEFPRRMFILMEAADDTLHTYVMDRRMKQATIGLTLGESLPLLVDLLRGIRDLEKQHIVHGDLTEQNVLVKDGRPLLAGFGRAAIVGEADDHFGVSGGVAGPNLAATTLQDVTRMPPETILGQPTGPSNNVYQVGAIFSWLCLGYVPMASAIDKEIAKAASKRKGGLDPELIDRAQHAIRRNFSIDLDLDSHALRDQDVVSILKGLLASSLDRRWTAVGALEEVMAIARRRNIHIPPERGPLTDAMWESDWE